MGHYVVREEGECGWLGRMNVRLGGEGVCWGWVGGEGVCLSLIHI